MPHILWVTACNGTATLLAAGFHPALSRSRRFRIVFLLGLGVPILLLPLAIPAELRNERFLAAVWSIITVGKLIDLYRGADEAALASLRAFAGFLINPFCLVFRSLPHEVVPSRRVNALRLARGVLIYSLIVGLFSLVDYRELVSSSFALEHIATTLLTMITIFAGAEAATALWRLPGLKAHDPFHNFFTAPTPAEFWRRYNRLAGQFFSENVFRPIQRRCRHRSASRVMAIMSVFALSGLVHEYIFCVAIGRVQGFQMLFFLVQGVAVSLTARIRPSGWSAAAWLLATIAFNVATVTIFYASWNQVAPFYSEAAPQWMTGGP